jgi:myo-inositol-1(or 4)-monophosphatase
MPMLQQRFYGYWAGNSGSAMPTGAYCNGNAIQVSQDAISRNHFFNLCTRSTQVLQNPVPVKIRMLGVATYNLLTIAMGIALGGVEATPKIWDIAATWVITQAAGAVWKPLDGQTIFPLQVGQDYRQRSFPTLVVARSALLPVFEPLVQVVVRR